jgi:hypothetical protein
MKKKITKKMMKLFNGPTIERNFYIEVADTVEGQAIIQELVTWLCDKRDSIHYLNGWIGPVDEK